MLVRSVAIVVCLALLAAGWTTAGDPPPAGVFAAPKLNPVPASVTNQCRLAQVKARFALLCPSLLPQPSATAIGKAPPHLLVPPGRSSCRPARSKSS